MHFQVLLMLQPHRVMNIGMNSQQEPRLQLAVFMSLQIVELMHQLAKANHTHQYLSNGDDGYKLVKGTRFNFTVIDVLGDWQGDPGSGWDVAGTTNGTKDKTLVRKPNGKQGNSN